MFGWGTAKRPWNLGECPVDEAVDRARAFFEIREQADASRSTRSTTATSRRTASRSRTPTSSSTRSARNSRSSRSRPACGCSGARRRTFVAPALHARRRDQLRGRRLLLRGRAGQEGDGVDARARRRGLRLLGRTRRLLDAAQHRHEARARSPRALPPHGGGLQEEDRVQGRASTSSPSPRSRPSTSTTPTPRRASTSSASTTCSTTSS